MKKLWNAIRRNPVINAFLLAVAVQVFHDWFANEIDWTNIAGYIATVFMGVAAREFTVPEKENKNLANNYKVLLSKHIELKNITEGWPKATFKPKGDAE